MGVEFYAIALSLVSAYAPLSCVSTDVSLAIAAIAFGEMVAQGDRVFVDAAVKWGVATDGAAIGLGAIGRCGGSAG